MLLPIYLHRVEALPSIVAISAIAQILYYAFALSFPSSILVARSAKSMATIVFASYSIFVLALMAFYAGMGAAAWLGYSEISQQALLIYLGFSITYSVYMGLLALYVRFDAQLEISYIKLIFGVASFLAAFIACKFFTSIHALVYGSAISYLATIGISLLTARSGLRRKIGTIFKKLLLLKDKYAETILYCKKNGEVGVASVASLVGFHGVNLLLIRLPEFSSFWAVVARISGGFASTGQQIIAPRFEAKIAGLVRNANSSKDLVNVQNSAVILGFGVGAVGCVALVLSLIFNKHAIDIIPNSALVCSLLYTLFVVGSSVIARNALILGLNRPYLILSIAKLSMLGISLLIDAQRSVLYFLVAIEIFYQGAYIFCCSHAAKGHRKHEYSK